MIDNNDDDSIASGGYSAVSGDGSRSQLVYDELSNHDEDEEETSDDSM
jgi:hypothetical protein